MACDTAPHPGAVGIGHHSPMARSAAQSDFVVSRPPPVVAAASELLPDGTEVSRAEPRSTEASAFATKWVMIATFVVLVALVVLCAVGPHIPAGE